MEVAPMSTTVLLAGVLPFVVLVASLLAIPVSLLLLRLYRNAVQRGMNDLGARTASGAEPAAVPRLPSSSLKTQLFDHDSIKGPRNKFSPAYRIAMHRPWQTAWLGFFCGRFVPWVHWCSPF